MCLGGVGCEGGRMGEGSMGFLINNFNLNIINWSFISCLVRACAYQCFEWLFPCGWKVLTTLVIMSQCHKHKVLGCQ